MIRVLLIALALTASCVRQRHENRTIVTKSGVRYWEYESREGIPDGDSQTYYANGQVRTDGFFLATQRHGLHRAFSPNGTLVMKAYFWHDVLVWTAHSEVDEPPQKLLKAIAGLTDSDEIRRRFGAPDQVSARGSFYGLDLGPPVASFSSSDRQVVGGDRIGIQLGAGGSTNNMLAALHYSVFGRVSRGKIGAFVQLDASSLSNATEYATGTLTGRQIMEAGGTYAIGDLLGPIATRLSLAVPVGHDDSEGYLSTAATSYQRPADAITSLPTTVALRASTSWVHRAPRWVLQTDGGIDLAMGGPPQTLPLFGRLNAALGVGVHSAMATVEVSSSMQLDDPSNRLHAAGLGAVLSAYGATLKSLFARSNGGHLTLTFGSEYAF